MIHARHLVRCLRTGPLLALVAAPTLMLGACASGTDYPSFAIPTSDPDGARVSARFPGVSVPSPRAPRAAPEAPPAELPTELDAALAAINARALAARVAFSENLAPVQQIARAAAKSDAESDVWTTAQIRLADLTSHHSAAQVALAQIDELAATAELAQNAQTDAQAIAALRAELAPFVSEQARQLAGINALLDP